MPNPEEPIVTGIPSPTLAVIGAGFGRTGTLSLREALVRLGFGPCDHMLENFEHPERFALWKKALQRKRAGDPIDWRPLLDGYRAIVDWPGAYFWRELIAAHPDAKVILTVRDPNRWYESCLATIFSMRARTDESPWARLMMRLVGLVLPPMREGFRVADDVIWKGTFDGRFLDREHALWVFAEHNREVQETVPAERLLVFDVKQGWRPLCAFLGVPVPEGESFPHVNDAESFQQRIQERFVQALVGLARPVAAGVAGLATLVWIARRARRARRKETT
jgi:Sulfotransferase domain